MSWKFGNRAACVAIERGIRMPCNKKWDIKNGVLWTLAFMATMIVSSWLTNLIVPIKITGQIVVGAEAVTELDHRWRLNEWVGYLVLFIVWLAFVYAQRLWQRRRSKLPGVLTPLFGPVESDR
jgi:membrane-anchored glycerophosphoryl diester phosphodiesterase (GDPDase)